MAVFLADQAVPSGAPPSLDGFASLPHASVYSLPSADGPEASSWMLPEAGPPLPQVRCHISQHDPERPVFATLSVVTCPCPAPQALEHLILRDLIEFSAGGYTSATLALARLGHDPSDEYWQLIIEVQAVHSCA